MISALKRLASSRPVLVLVSLMCMYIAGGFWYRAVADGFTPLRITQVVLATGLVAVSWVVCIQRESKRDD